MDISWFMRILNQSITIQTNHEKTVQFFWEGRLKSHTLLDEAALAICITYVDLNPSVNDIDRQSTDNQLGVY